MSRVLKEHSKRPTTDAERARPLRGSPITLPGLEGRRFIVGDVFEGGMGRVLQLFSVDPLLPTCALKTFKALDNRSQFEREARLWLSLGAHPYIAETLWYGEWQGLPCILGPWYSKTPSSELVQGWPTSKCLAFAAQLIQGLRYASGHGLIHQDIKPSNILLDDDDVAHVSDFGVATLAPRGTSLPVRRAGPTPLDLQTTSFRKQGVAGSPFYMAPELFNGAVASVRTDIYSLAVTLYQLLTGEHPYAGPETDNFFRPALRAAPLRRVALTRGDAARPLLELITLASAINPAHRPETYEALIANSGFPLDISGGANEDHSASQSILSSISLVQALRKQERYEEATAALERALAEHPEEPGLLNAMGLLRLATGHSFDAIDTFAAAVVALRPSRGVREGLFYGDPIANLASVLLTERRYNEAARALMTFHDWSIPSVAADSYAEVGWLSLWDGRCAQAIAHLLRLYTKCAPDRRSLGWLALAAFIVRRHPPIAYDALLAQIECDEIAYLIGCLAASGVTNREGRALLKSLERRNEEAVVAAAELFSLPPESLREPLSGASAVNLAIWFDQLATGGRLRERILAAT